MLSALIGPIANLASSWMNSKVEKVKAEGQAKEGTRQELVLREEEINGNS